MRGDADDLSGLAVCALQVFSDLKIAGLNEILPVFAPDGMSGGDSQGPVQPGDRDIENVRCLVSHQVRDNLPARSVVGLDGRARADRNHFGLTNKPDFRQVQMDHATHCRFFLTKPFGRTENLKALTDASPERESSKSG